MIKQNYRARDTGRSMFKVHDVDKNDDIGVGGTLTTGAKVEAD